MFALKYLCLVLFAMVGCTERKTTVLVQPAELEPVALEVEVYDPVTNFVWENVAVRIVEAEVSGAGGSFTNIFPDDWFFSDQNGLVFAHLIRREYSRTRILLTGDVEAEAGLAHEVNRVGFAFLAKPFKRRQFLTAVAKTLEQSAPSSDENEDDSESER